MSERGGWRVTVRDLVPSGSRVVALPYLYDVEHLTTAIALADCQIVKRTLYVDTHDRKPVIEGTHLDATVMAIFHYEDGQPAPGVEVTIGVDGRTYAAVTNSSGWAVWRHVRMPDNAAEVVVRTGTGFQDRHRGWICDETPSYDRVLLRETTVVDLSVRVDRTHARFGESVSVAVGYRSRSKHVSLDLRFCLMEGPAVLASVREEVKPGESGVATLTYRCTEEGEHDLVVAVYGEGAIEERPLTVTVEEMRITPLPSIEPQVVATTVVSVIGSLVVLVVRKRLGFSRSPSSSSLSTP